MKIPSDHLAVCMGEIINKWRFLMDKEAKKIGLSRPEWRVFFKISSDHSPRLTQLDIAHSLTIDQGLLTRVIDKLEERNLVKRTVDDYDHRVKNISLTEEASPMVEQLTAAIDRIQAAIFHEFSEEERALFVKFLKQTEIAINALSSR